MRIGEVGTGREELSKTRFMPESVTKEALKRGQERNSRSLHCATPDFLWILVESANFMRLSLMKAAHVAVSQSRWQEIRVRSGRMTNFRLAQISVPHKL